MKIFLSLHHIYSDMKVVYEANFQNFLSSSIFPGLLKLLDVFMTPQKPTDLFNRLVLVFLSIVVCLLDPTTN